MLLQWISIYDLVVSHVADSISNYILFTFYLIKFRRKLFTALIDRNSYDQYKRILKTTVKDLISKSAQGCPFNDLDVYAGGL